MNLKQRGLMEDSLDIIALNYSKEFYTILYERLIYKVNQ